MIIFSLRGAGLCAAAVLVTGCGAHAQTEDAVREAAARFSAAVASGDLQAACELLSERAREMASDLGDGDCTQGLSDVPGGDEEAARVEVWGAEAQASTTADTLFLHRYPEGWLVKAAGCTPEADRPYDCAVEG